MPQTSLMGSLSAIMKAPSLSSGIVLHAIYVIFGHFVRPVDLTIWAEIDVIRHLLSMPYADD